MPPASPKCGITSNSLAYSRRRRRRKRRMRRGEMEQFLSTQITEHCRMVLLQNSQIDQPSPKISGQSMCQHPDVTSFLLNFLLSTNPNLQVMLSFSQLNLGDLVIYI